MGFNAEKQTLFQPNRKSYINVACHSGHCGTLACDGAGGRLGTLVAGPQPVVPALVLDRLGRSNSAPPRRLVVVVVVVVAAVPRLAGAPLRLLPAADQPRRRAQVPGAVRGRRPRRRPGRRVPAPARAAAGPPAPLRRLRAESGAAAAPPRPARRRAARLPQHGADGLRAAAPVHRAPAAPAAALRRQLAPAVCTQGSGHVDGAILLATRTPDGRGNET